MMRRQAITRVSCAAAAVVLWTGGAAFAQQVNLLENPGFEGASGLQGDMPGWGAFNQAYGENNGTDGVFDRTGTGTGVGKLFGPFFNNPNASGFYQSFETKPGTTYQLHVYSYMKTGDDLTSTTADNFVLERIAFFDAGGQEIVDAGRNVTILDKDSPKDVWIDNPTDVATAPAGAASAQAFVLFIQPQKAGGAGFFDDASFYQQPNWWFDSDGNWSNGGNWGLSGAPNGVDVTAKLGPVITGNHTVNVDGARTVGTLIFDNANSYTLGGTGPLSLHVSTGRATIDVANGSHVVNTTVTADSPVTILLEQPSSNLTIGASGQLDVKDKNVVIDYAGASPAGQVVGSLLSGRNGGSWNGHGIMSSTAAAAANLATALGWAEASDLLGLSGGATGAWQGTTVDASSILLKYTYYGDLNLDGKVNADDYARLDRGRSKGLTGWINGDVNYDGTVNGADYALTDAAFLHQGGVLSAETLAERSAMFGPEYNELLTAALPEPGALGLLSAAGLVVARRRCRD